MLPVIPQAWYASDDFIPPSDTPPPLRRTEEEFLPPPPYTETAQDGHVTLMQVSFNKSLSEEPLCQSPSNDILNFSSSLPIDIQQRSTMELLPDSTMQESNTMATTNDASSREQLSWIPGAVEDQEGSQHQCGAPFCHSHRIRRQSLPPTLHTHHHSLHYPTVPASWMYAHPHSQTHPTDLDLLPHPHLRTLSEHTRRELSNHLSQLYLAPPIPSHLPPLRYTLTPHVRRKRRHKKKRLKKHDNGYHDNEPTINNTSQTTEENSETFN